MSSKIHSSHKSRSSMHSNRVEHRRDSSDNRHSERTYHRAEINAERKIRPILANYRANIYDTVQATEKIMEVMRKHRRGYYDEPSGSTTSSKMSTVSQATVVEKKLTTTKVQQTLKPAAPPTAPGPSPKTSANKKTVAKKAQPKPSIFDSGERVPNELKNLLNSDGFVVTPVRSKRMRKAVARFIDIKFDAPSPQKRKGQQKSKTAANGFTVTDSRTSQGRRSVSTTSSVVSAEMPQLTPTPARDVTKTTTTITQSVFQRQSISSVQPSTSASVRSITQTTSTITKNFLHNNVRIYHVPIPEIKLEKQNPQTGNVQRQIGFSRQSL